MIYECVTCQHRHKTPHGANWCDELDMRLHPNPSNGKCILCKVKPQNNETDGIQD